MGIKSDPICGLSDITAAVAGKISELGFKHGNVTIFIAGSTGGVTTMEYEPGLIQDLPGLFEKLIPSSKSYHHDQTWGDGNGFSHLRAALLGASLTIPFENGKLLLGTWQQIVVVNFDNRSRNREIILQFIGT